MADVQRGGLSERIKWWLGGLVGGALVGGLLAALGSVVLGLVFVLPFAAARGRAGATIAGALAGCGLAAIVVHGLSSDVQTITAAITLAAGLFLTGIALTKR